MLSRTTNFDRARFNQDYLSGLLGENAFKRQCIIWGMTILKETPKSVFPDYDFKLQYQGTRERAEFPTEKITLPVPETHELKTDLGTTPNIPIHFYSSSKKQTDNFLPNCSLPCNAGLYRTKADFYTVFNPHDETFYIAPVHMLKDYLENPGKGIKKVLANRNKSEQTGIALVPKAVWLKEFYYLPYTADEYTEI